MGRTIICCFDGTGNKFKDSENTNIVRFFSALKKDNPERQCVFYQPGIGTSRGGLTSRFTWEDAKMLSALIIFVYSVPVFFIIIRGVVGGFDNVHWGDNIVISLVVLFIFALMWSLSWLSLCFNQAIAVGLDDHVICGYRFIMQNYREGDRICLFGFSRGACIARVLAGMLHKVGLLPVHNDQLVDFAYEIFHTKGRKGHQLCREFKSSCAIPVTVDFVGVWDTVSTVGIFPRQVTFSTSTSHGIKVFRHALALDERRTHFRPNTWAEPAIDDDKYVDFDAPEPQDATVKALKEEHGTKPEAGLVPKWYSIDWIFMDRKLRPVERDTADVREVWFAGAHCDVGGGSTTKDGKMDLSLIPFQWMIKECIINQKGIIFDPNTLATIGVNWHWIKKDLEEGKVDLGKLESGLAKYIESLPDESATETTKMTMGFEISDQLRGLWWISEFLPSWDSYQLLSGYRESWRRDLRPNVGWGRYLPVSEGVVRVHPSVKLFEGKGYKPKAYNWDSIKELGLVKWEDQYRVGDEDVIIA
ncbi:hypothetical protein AX16_005004 [Volvariella volvacea WC 439]|nr:hypothetical protein AX16_005004 [Volvariella volvacea WC 439]